MKKQIVGALACLGWSFMASACGLISGVSDDYTYERADGAADAISVTDSTRPSRPDPRNPNDAQLVDARSPEAGPDAALGCARPFAQPTGIADGCYSCILKNCCNEAQRCGLTSASTEQCGAYLRCLSMCKPGAGSGAEACRLNCTLSLIHVSEPTRPY